MIDADVAPPNWVVKAPTGTLSAALERRSGRLRLTIVPSGVQVDLGRPQNGPLIARRGRFRARFTTPAGKRRHHLVRGRTLTVAGITVLVTRDGVAFRGAPSATFVTPRGTRSWLQRYTGAYEDPYRSAIAGQDRYGVPALLRSDGRYTLLTESGVARGHVGSLERRGRSLRVRSGSRLWQVAVTGSLADVVRSDLPLALGRPSRIADTSWIEPGRAAWSWLADHASSTSAAAQRAAVDAAIAHGWEYVTIDAGWDAAWVPGVIAYAREQGIKTILWYDQADVDEAVLDQAARWGAAGVKVDYFYSDRPERIAKMDDIARWAARRRLVVAFHGCTVPRGLQRTWPNVLTLEGVRGAEHAPTNPRDDVNLAFTRNVVGSMDYTPIADPAKAIVYESGLQHYTAAGPLLDEIPAAWDDTRLLAGRPDRYAVVARRSGERWFVGGLFAAPERVTVPLPAGRWHARFADGTERDVERDADGGRRLRGDPQPRLSRSSPPSTSPVANAVAPSTSGGSRSSSRAPSSSPIATIACAM